VLDAYYAPYQPDIAHDVRSVTKSVLSTLTAIAIRNCQLDGVDHPVMDLFSDKQIPDIDDNKKAITVQQLLDRLRATGTERADQPTRYFSGILGLIPK
jgi:CubicO group peptidase (beta-lactamase class C family)